MIAEGTGEGHGLINYGREEDLSFARADKLVVDGAQLMKDGYAMVGRGLQIIKEEQHWRRTHKSFKAFVVERYGFSESWAYKKMKHHKDAQRIDSLCTGDTSWIKTDAHVEELSTLTDAQVSKVVNQLKEEAETNGKSLSVGLIKEVKERVIGASPKPKEKPQLEGTEKTEEALANGDELRKIVVSVRSVVTAIKQVEPKPGLEELYENQSAILLCAEKLRAAIAMSIPDSACPRCNGVGCEKCNNKGWVNAIIGRELRDEALVDF